jgi:two-component sensor histidine kinase/CheY-like chemotaxis protein
MPVNRKLLRVMLEAEGYATLEAGDGVEALQILNSEKVDAVISDVLMPRMDGYRLCHEIRTNQHLCELPIVIYTSTYTEPSDEKLALALGADRYLKKPSPAAAILATLKEAVAMSHAEPQHDALRQVEVLKEYSDRLVSKLEERNIELEERVRQLMAVDAELRDAHQKLETANANLLLKVDELSKSNGEKNVLLQEVHHRVNNNLQVICSLLRMQTESCGDAQVAAGLRTSLLRIESMAMIHEQLYESADLRQVDFAEYSKRLAENLFLSYGVDRDRVVLRVNMAGLTLGVNQAIPAGLILNELITNAIKYAFPEQRRGSIRIKGGIEGEAIHLAVCDDGVGIPQTTALQVSTQGRRSSDGLNIVSILCRQLNASFEQTQRAGDPSPGAMFRISFNRKLLSTIELNTKEHNENSHH